MTPYKPFILWFPSWVHPSFWEAPTRKMQEILAVNQAWAGHSGSPFKQDGVKGRACLVSLMLWFGLLVCWFVGLVFWRFGALVVSWLGLLGLGLWVYFYLLLVGLLALIV